MAEAAIDKPAHSPLGASAAERWMNCPGSVTLLKRLDLPTSEESDWAMEGTGAHEALAHCLQTGQDAWEIVGETFNKGRVEVTTEMADAIQMFINDARPDMLEPDVTVMIEERISHPDHEFFYGTVDHSVIFKAHKRLKVRDFKYGAGITVDVEENPQLMYYAYGILYHHPEVEEVELTIIQPRGFHVDGPVRRWSVDAEYIRDWAESTMFPAMEAAQFETDLDAGKWCRFCPAKLVCPLMSSLFKAAATYSKAELPALTTLELGRSYQYVAAVKQYIGALEAECFNRLNRGDTEANDFIKLVPKKANRVFRSEVEVDGKLVKVEDVLKAALGDDIYTKPELKSPAEVEKIDAQAKKLVREYAYKPDTGFTVALASDNRVGVRVQTVTEAFPREVLDAAAT